MINKLPEAGKRYRHLASGSINTVSKITHNETVWFEESHPNGLSICDDLEGFFDKYEEYKEIGEKFTVNFTQDGDKICATLYDFINLQESPAGFGDDKEEALVALIYDLKQELERRKCL